MTSSAHWTHRYAQTPPVPLGDPLEAQAETSLSCKNQFPQLRIRWQVKLFSCHQAGLE